MRPVPGKLKIYLLTLPQVCMRSFEGDCAGRVTWEHCWIYAGKQINEAWAIIFLCEYHHLGKGLEKNKNRWLSVNLMSVRDMEKYPLIDWKQQQKYLNKIYGSPRYITHSVFR